MIWDVAWPSLCVIKYDGFLMIWAVPSTDWQKWITINFWTLHHFQIFFFFIFSFHFDKPLLRWQIRGILIVQWCEEGDSWVPRTALTGKTLKKLLGFDLQEIEMCFLWSRGSCLVGCGTFAAFVNCFSPKISNRQFSPRKHAQGCPTRGEEWVGRASGVGAVSLLRPHSDPSTFCSLSARLCASSKPPTPSRGVLSVQFDRCRLTAQRG